MAKAKARAIDEDTGVPLTQSAAGWKKAFLERDRRARASEAERDEWKARAEVAEDQTCKSEAERDALKSDLVVALEDLEAAEHLARFRGEAAGAAESELATLRAESERLTRQWDEHCAYHGSESPHALQEALYRASDAESQCKALAEDRSALRREVERVTGLARATAETADKLLAERTSLRSEVERLRADVASADTNYHECAKARGAAESRLAAATELIVRAYEKEDAWLGRLIEEDMGAFLANQPATPTLGHPGADEVFARLQAARQAAAATTVDAPFAFATVDRAWLALESFFHDDPANKSDEEHECAQQAFRVVADDQPAAPSLGTIKLDDSDAAPTLPDEPDVDVSDWRVPPKPNDDRTCCMADGRTWVTKAERRVLDAMSEVDEDTLRNTLESRHTTLDHWLVAGVRCADHIEALVSERVKLALCEAHTTLPDEPDVDLIDFGSPTRVPGRFCSEAERRVLDAMARLSDAELHSLAASGNNEQDIVAAELARREAKR